MTKIGAMGIGSNASALRALLASLDRDLETAYERITPPPGRVEEVLDARIRIRELQTRRELVVRRLAELTSTNDEDSPG